MPACGLAVVLRLLPRPPYAQPQEDLCLRELLRLYFPNHFELLCLTSANSDVMLPLNAAMLSSGWGLLLVHGAEVPRDQCFHALVWSLAWLFCLVAPFPSYIMLRRVP